MSNQDVFLEANAALSERNYEKFIAYCDEDIIWINVGGSAFNGRTETLKYISSTYNDVTFTTEDHIKEKDVVIEYGQIEFKTEGLSKKSSYCDIWKFKDGRISKVTSFVI